MVKAIVDNEQSEENLRPLLANEPSAFWFFEKPSSHSNRNERIPSIFGKLIFYEKITLILTEKIFRHAKKGEEVEMW